MNQHPSEILDHSNMSQQQVFAVVLCIALNALDGFDVLAISFASPGIAAEWAINRAELGVVLAMELVGMAIGSIFLGGFADKIGRKPTIQACLVIMTAGMCLSAFANSVAWLLTVRFVTGLGIGGMLASTNAMVAEYSNRKYRHLCVILMATGYPLGAIIGGSISSVLLETYSWRSVFVFGGAVTGAFLIIVQWCMSESVVYLAARQPVNALQRINSGLQRMGKPLLSALPPLSHGTSNNTFTALFTPQLRATTLLLIAAYFAQIMTFYFILKWIPKIVVDMDFHPSQAGQVLVWANVGGAIGATLLGLFSSKLPLKQLLVIVLLAGFVMVSVFGIGYQSLSQLALVSAATGFFTNAGVVGLYALMAQAFPPEVRGSGTGIVIGVGRGGAALSPVVAGILFTQGVSLQGVAVVMGAGALAAAVAVILLGRVQQLHTHQAITPNSTN
ncbi:MFS transporter [Alteromonas lipolytica]|uniref:MFS transporter n=1 Tax=Alteromonas lipolytica TaxID=1856405 RepID=A0A1E8FJ26_9ALTE|nr:MFS transporter [Alteromonas lipolytica]OFI35925.1 MFS transporter [Alteromonas lipolytica]GGF72534.1 MFS transporter [Alteromonas lipolytica]